MPVIGFCLFLDWEVLWKNPGKIWISWTCFKGGDQGKIEIPVKLVFEILELINEDPDQVIGKIIESRRKPDRKKKEADSTNHLQELKSIMNMSIIKTRR